MAAVTDALRKPQRPSFLGVNLVKACAIGKVGFVGFFPATKGLVDGEEVSLGNCLAYLAWALGEIGR